MTNNSSTKSGVFGVYYSDLNPWLNDTFLWVSSTSPLGWNFQEDGCKLTYTTQKPSDGLWKKPRSADFSLVYSEFNGDIPFFVLPNQGKLNPWDYFKNPYNPTQEERQLFELEFQQVWPPRDILIKFKDRVKDCFISFNKGKRKKKKHYNKAVKVLK